MQVKFLKTVATMNGIYLKGEVYDTKKVPNYMHMVKVKQCELITPKGANK